MSQQSKRLRCLFQKVLYLFLAKYTFTKRQTPKLQRKYIYNILIYSSPCAILYDEIFTEILKFVLYIVYVLE
jgi:hypothetical protein